MSIRRAIATVTLAVGAGLLAAPAATAESCFYEDAGQEGSSRCYPDNVQDFTGHTFPNGHSVRDTASSWRNLNTVYNEGAYSEPNYKGVYQELEDETAGNLIYGIDNKLGSFDAA